MAREQLTSILARVLVYTVIIELPSPALTDELLAWLEDDHLGEVVRAGARDAEAVVLDGETATVECRYTFDSREAFAAYEAGPAEVLRADGRARFGPDRGIRMRRTIGISVARRG